MTLQRFIGTVLLAYGIVFGAMLIRRALYDRKAVEAESGRFSLLSLLEVGVCFLVTLGISDYLLNTLVSHRFAPMETKKLPGTLVVAGMLPAAIIAFFLLKVDDPISLSTLIPCAISIVCGALFGVRIVTGLDSERVRKYMAIALIVSLGALVFRIILTRGAAGTATSLSIPKLIIAVVVAFFWGAVNMLGVPMKPAGTALFLLLGLSPLSTLTLVLVLACISVLGGSIPMMRSGLYHQKLSCASAVGGSIGAVLGSLFAISLHPTLLNIILMIVMVVAIRTLVKKKEH